MKYYITCVQKLVSPYGIYEDVERLRELVVCKDCLKKDICLMYRQCKDDYGYCSCAERKDGYVTLHHEDIHFIDEDAERAFYESLAERKDNEAD